jgi:hypothetical protein
VHQQAILELCRLEVAHVRFQHERLEAEVAQPLVAAGESLQVVDARHLEPHEVVGVVGDSLRIGLRKAHPHLS